jgi:membrane protein YdbS with pleckstrin-like domain
MRGMNEPRRPRSRKDYERGLPDHHDPTAGFAGAPPAQSALTLRLVLAVFGLVVCVAGGLGWLATDLPVWPAVVLFVLATVAVVDLVVIVRRKARGEPG